MYVIIHLSKTVESTIAKVSPMKLWTLGNNGGPG